jgi:AcrR family transcriptional regulator
MTKFTFALKKEYFAGPLRAAEYREIQILEMAFTLIQRSGFENLHFDQLARKCRVSRPLIHHY